MEPATGEGDGNEASSACKGPEAEKGGVAGQQDSSRDDPHPALAVHWP